MDIQIKMPDLATTADTVTVLKWLIEVGQPVQRGQPLLEIETDKARMPIESITSGTLQAVLVQAGQEVAVGAAIAIVSGAPADGARPAPAKSPTEQTTSPRAPASTGAPAPSLTAERKAAAGAAAGASSDAFNQAADQALDPPVDRYETAFLSGIYERMVLIRQFEDRVKMLFLEGSMPGTIHQCQGQEATAVGVCSALNVDDYITSTHRPHGHALAKGLTPQELLIELFGGGTGCCKGKGGSMHVGNVAKGMVPAIAIVAGGIPLAAGMALAFKMKKTDQVVACYFGDGGNNEGAFHEGLNLASIWDLPVLYVCENNLYGASTAIGKVMKPARVADRSAAYGMPGRRVNGNAVLEVHETTRLAAQWCRAGKGPVLLEMLTYRTTGHSRRDPCHYQPDKEKADWTRLDPIQRLRRKIVEAGVMDEQRLDRIDADVERQIELAVEAGRAAPQPSIEELTTDVYD